MQLYNGDCLEVMKNIPDKSIDMVLCDLPYGTTACKWDTVIPFELLWGHYNRIVKNNGVIALFGSEPFSTELRHSNLKMFRYDWIWEKVKGTNFLSSKKQPLKNHEIISIFYLDKAEVTGRSEKFKSLRDYFYNERIKTGFSSKEINLLLGNKMASHYFTKGVQFTIPTEENYKKLQSTGFFNKDYQEIKEEFEEIAKDCRFTYNPQMTEGTPYVKKGGNAGEVYGGLYSSVISENNGVRYPTSVQKFNGVSNKNRLHPTQKPVALLEYLIKTYTNKGETVLDNCMGSGSTGIACVNTNRNFIGIELDKNYFDIAKRRIRGEMVKNGMV